MKTSFALAGRNMFQKGSSNSVSATICAAVWAACAVFPHHAEAKFSLFESGRLSNEASRTRDFTSELQSSSLSDLLEVDGLRMKAMIEKYDKNGRIDSMRMAETESRVRDLQKWVYDQNAKLVDGSETGAQYPTPHVPSKFHMNTFIEKAKRKIGNAFDDLMMLL